MAKYCASCVLIALLLAGNNTAGRQVAGGIESRPGSDLSRILAGAPRGSALGLSGVAYYRDRLYVATSIGLLELDGDRVITIHRTGARSSVVSGPWVDAVANLMWILDANTNELVRFDGTTWTRAPMPTPERGYYSRGDVLTGPMFVGTDTSFWLSTAGSVWKWDTAGKAWSVATHPPSIRAVDDINELAGAIPVGTELMFITRHEAFPFLIQPDEAFKSDTIVRRVNAEWQRLPAEPPTPFFAESWTFADGVGYVCTTKGELLKVTPRGITRLEAPGPCETIARSRTGHLLGSFKRRGVYELDKTWQQLAAHPYPSGAGEYWVHLAGDARGVGIAIHAKPVVDRTNTGPNIRFTTNAPTGLWVGRGASLIQLRTQ